MSVREKMQKMLGNYSHKDCKNSYCSSRGKGKKEKSEHIFVEKGTFLGNKWGWECMACGEFTKVASV